MHHFNRVAWLSFFKMAAPSSIQKAIELGFYLIVVHVIQERNVLNLSAWSPSIKHNAWVRCITFLFFLKDFRYFTLEIRTILRLKCMQHAVVKALRSCLMFDFCWKLTLSMFQGVSPKWGFPWTGSQTGSGTSFINIAWWEASTM